MQSPSPMPAVVSLIAVMVLSGLVVLAGPVGFALWLAAVISFCICWVVFLYQAWGCMPWELQPVGRGQMVGRLFIPIYNIYWVFVAVRGLSTRTQMVLAARGERIPGLRELSMVVCILAVLGPVIMPLPLFGTAYLSGAPVITGLWLLTQWAALQRLHDVRVRTWTLWGGSLACSALRDFACFVPCLQSLCLASRV